MPRDKGFIFVFGCVGIVIDSIRIDVVGVSTGGVVVAAVVINVVVGVTVGFDVAMYAGVGIHISAVVVVDVEVGCCRCSHNINNTINVTNVDNSNTTAIPTSQPTY